MDPAGRKQGARWWTENSKLPLSVNECVCWCLNRLATCPGWLPFCPTHAWLDSSPPVPPSRMKQVHKIDGPVDQGNVLSLLFVLMNYLTIVL